MFGFLIEIALGIVGFLAGRNVRERHLARRAANPGREALRVFITRAAIIAVVVWALGFHGLQHAELFLAGRI